LVNSASKLIGQEKPTTDHVVLSLARRSVSHGMSGSIERHLGGTVTARSMLGKLIDNAGTATSKSAARVFASAAAPTAGSGGSPAGDAPAKAPRRARPTTQPSDKKPTPLAVKQAVRTRGSRKRRSAGGPSGSVKLATDTTAKKSPNRAPANKAAAKKTPAKKTPAKKGTAKKAAKKVAGKKAPAKKVAGTDKGTTRRSVAKKAAATRTTGPFGRGGVGTTGS
jgi:hypothetical protein